MEVWRKKVAIGGGWVGAALKAKKSIQPLELRWDKRGLSCPHQLMAKLNGLLGRGLTARGWLFGGPIMGHFRECVFSKVMLIKDGCVNRLGQVDSSQKSLQNCTGRRDDPWKFDVAVLF